MRTSHISTVTLLITVCWSVLELCSAGKSKDKNTVCPLQCEPEKCPNIGPIKVSECPEPYIKTDRCGCCKRCDIVHLTTTISPQMRDKVCEQVSCPKKQLCVMNRQGLPVCRCPSEDLCKKTSSKSFGIRRNKVCGSDGVTYPTRCHLKVASCQNDRKIRAVYKGSCSEMVSPANQLLPSADSVNDGTNQLEDDYDEESDIDDKQLARKERRREEKRIARRMKRKKQREQEKLFEAARLRL